MKKIVLPLLLIFIGYVPHAQKASSYVSLNTGVSLPLGKFSSKTLDGGSFALAGWNSNVEGAWFFYKDLGAGLQLGYSAHPVDVRSLGYEKVQNDPFLMDLYIRSDPYRQISLAGFFLYSFSITDKLSLTPKAGGGFLYGSSPYQLYKPEYFMVSSKWYEITSTNDMGGYFMAGATFRYPLSGCLDVVLSGEYGYGVLKYRFLTGSGDIREDVHHAMTLNILAGIGIKL